jgi:hypothetical protein
MGRKTRTKNSEVTQVIPAALPDEEIDSVFAELVALHRGATLDHAIRSGEVLIRRLFGGSIAAWRERSTDDASLRKLVAKVEKTGYPGLSATGLYRAIEIYDLDLRVGVSGRKQLNAGHARAVLGLTDQQQELLLGKAEANDWTAERLEKEVARVRHRKGKGRRPQPRFVKTVNALERLLHASDDAFADLDKIADLSDEEADRLAAAAAEMSAKCADIAAALRKRRS